MCRDFHHKHRATHPVGLYTRPSGPISQVLDASSFLADGPHRLRNLSYPEPGILDLWVPSVSINPLGPPDRPIAPALCRRFHPRDPQHQTCLLPWQQYPAHRPAVGQCHAHQETRQCHRLSPCSDDRFLPVAVETLLHTPARASLGHFSWCSIAASWPLPVTKSPLTLKRQLHSP